MNSLYIETTIAAGLDRVWDASQDPAAHQRWDARFGHIDYLPGTSPQQFRYATLGVAGTGVCAGERRGERGAVSVLRFASGHRLSVIAEGSGYWRYVPTEAGTRFLTGYDYRARHRLLDVVFRPLMGWATAWSFDRLRLWLEEGVTPERARANALLDVGARVATVAAVLVVAGPLAALAMAGLASFIPPHRYTPAARRCARRPEAS